MPSKRQGEIQHLIDLYTLGRNGHAHFSPSGSAGWLNCDGYILANAGKPDMGRYDAAYGTVAHEVAAVWLTAIREEGRKKAEHVPKRFLDFVKMENGYRIVVDSDMLVHIRRYIDWCHEVEILGDVHIEQRVDYSEYMPIPKQGGTADHFICVGATIDQDGTMLEGGHLIITDLKMGIGYAVMVERNSQAMLYALGVYLAWNWLYSFRKITIRICQPRLDYFGVWECTVDDLLEFAETVRAAADRGWRLNGTRTPGPKQCMWCDDRTCAAKSMLVEDLTDEAFEEAEEDLTPLTETLSSPEYSEKDMDGHALDKVVFGNGPAVAKARPARDLDTALAAWRYSHWTMIKRYFNDLREELLRREAEGEKIPGLKTIRGRRSFKWNDEGETCVALRGAGLSKDQILISEVTSVNGAKKALRALGLKPKEIEHFLHASVDGVKAPLVDTVQGKRRLVKDDDERMALSDEIDDAFSEEDDEL